MLARDYVQQQHDMAHTVFAPHAGKMLQVMAAQMEGMQVVLLTRDTFGAPGELIYVSPDLELETGDAALPQDIRWEWRQHSVDVVIFEGTLTVPLPNEKPFAITIRVTRTRSDSYVAVWFSAKMGLNGNSVGLIAAALQQINLVTGIVKGRL